MKRLLKIIISLAVVIVFVYSFRHALPNEGKLFFADFLSRLSTNFTLLVRNILPPPVPCANPIEYEIATFDARFGISKEYFIDAITVAETLWEKVIGKELFSYSERNGFMKINLIYDYRQEATEKLGVLSSDVKDDQALYDASKLKYESLKNQYAQAKNDYQASVSAFNEKNIAYQKQVDYWNSQGGAPKDDYARLSIERQELQKISSQLQMAQNQLNVMGTEINTLVTALNRLVKTLNITATKYNEIGASRGESFEEGVYHTDGYSKEIDIYEFSDREKLVRVLAHELGHALGLEHVLDPKAIMYELNQGIGIKLTQDDVEALKAICNVR